MTCEMIYLACCKVLDYWSIFVPTREK